MAAPTTSTCQSSFIVEISSDGTNWTDISGSAVSLSLDGGDQMIGEQRTAENNFALLVACGKTEPYNLTIRSVYSEDNPGAFLNAWSRFTGATKTLAARWSPRGGAAGTARFFTSADGSTDALVPIVSCTPPDQSAEDAGLALFELQLRSPALGKETI